jgi:magnesium-protoporphyrin IX monomethyl ester (oxidative) cyclase
MRVLLLHPSTNYFIKAPSVPLGVLSIATFLQNHGHTVRISDRCIKKENIKKLVRAFEPDIVGLSIMSARGIKDAEFISRTIKKLNIPVIWGGHYPTFNYEDALKSGLVDAVVLNEGEVTTIEMLDELAKNHPINRMDHIDGLAFIRNNEVIVTKPRAFADPANLPVIDYSNVDVPKYFQTWFGCKRMLYLYGSKGCPFACTFCYNKAYNSQKYRKRPNEDIFSEIDYLVNEHGMDGIYFTDDVFCPNKEELRAFCSVMKQKNYSMTWGCQARIGQFDREDFELLYDAGCKWVFFGIETGSEEMQKKVDKNLDFSKMDETFGITKEIGIITISSLIIGFPNETEEQLRDTIDLAKRIKADLYPVNLYTPNIEQDLCKELIEKGVFNPPHTLKEHAKLNQTNDYFNSFSTVPKRELMVIRSYFHWISFTKKSTASSSKSFEFAGKAINDAFLNIFRFGIVSFIFTSVNSIKMFTIVAWNVFAHPKIRKKYGLFDREK